MASLGSLTLDLIAKTGGFTGPIDRARNQSSRSFRQMERDAKKAALGIAKITGAAAAATAGLVAYAKIGMDNVDAQAKLARSLEATIGDLRGISLAASDAGVEQGKLNSALMSYNKRLGDAVRDTGPAKQAYKDLGIEASKLVNMPMAEQLALVAERINQLDSAAERQSIADALMSNGRNVVKLFESGGDAIRDAIDEVDGLGLAISDVDAAKIEEANDAISRIGLVSEAAQNAVAIGLAPVLGDLADMLVEVAKAFQAGEYDRQIKLLVDVGKVAAVAGTAYGTYRVAIAAATIAQYAFNVAVRANPLMALVSAATAAVGAAYVFREELGLVDGVARRAEQALDGATGAIHDGSLAAINNSYDALSESLLEVRSSAQEATLAVLELERAKALYDRSHKGLASGAEAEIARQHGIQAEAWKTMVEMQAKQKELDGKREEIEKRISEVGKGRGGPVTTGGGAPRAASRAAGQAAREAEAAAAKMAQQIIKQRDAYISLRDTLYPIQASQKRFAEEKLLLDQHLVAGTDEHTDAVKRLRDTYRNAGEVSDAYASRAAEGLDRVSDAADKLGFTFESAFESAVIGGNDLRDVLSGILEDIAKIAIRETVSKPLSGAISAGIGSMLGGGGISGGFTSEVWTGQAHDGIHSVPADGTWNLQKGERVVTSQTSAKLDRTLDAVMRSGAGGGTSVQIIDQRSGGERAQVEETRGADGMRRIRVLIRDEIKGAMADGSMDSAMARNYGQKRRSL